MRKIGSWAEAAEFVAPLMTEKQHIPPDYWATAEVMKGIFETKTCLAQHHSPESCQGKIVTSHTIPRSQLQKIAPDGHVYAVAGTLADLARTDGKLAAKKYGIRTFSVLNCFCAIHDNKVFSHLEDDDLVFDLHQLSLCNTGHWHLSCTGKLRRITRFWFRSRNSKGKNPRKKIL